MNRLLTQGSRFPFSIIDVLFPFALRSRHHFDSAAWVNETPARTFFGVSKGQRAVHIIFKELFALAHEFSNTLPLDILALRQAQGERI